MAPGYTAYTLDTSLDTRFVSENFHLFTEVIKDVYILWYVKMMTESDKN